MTELHSRSQGAKPNINFVLPDSPSHIGEAITTRVNDQRTTTEEFIIKYSPGVAGGYASHAAKLAVEAGTAGPWTEYTNRAFNGETQVPDTSLQPKPDAYSILRAADENHLDHELDLQRISRNELNGGQF